MIAIKYASNSTLTGATTTAGVAVDSATDFTGAIDLSGLAADTQYWYTRVIDGVEQDAAPYPSFKTFPASGAATSFSFAFGSCTKHSDTIGEDSIFNAIPAGTRFFLHLGDTVYADRDSPIATTLPDYRTQHRAALTGLDITSQDYKALRARMPVFTTWDDHDLANDFSGGTGAAIYAPAKQAFQEYGARANPDSLTAGELYYTFQYGDVGFFVLDGRSFRSSNSATDNSSKTLLGTTQKTALKNWLLTNKTALTLKFICSSTPAHGYGANTGGDSWGGVDDGTQAPNGANGFRTERNEIFDYIDANQIPGVVIVSGDQHWAGSFKTTYANRPRYEFMSTPLNMTNTASFMLPEVARTADPMNGPVFWKLDNTMNVGLVTVDTTVTPAAVSFQLYGTSGSLGASYLTSLTTDDIDANLIPEPAIAIFYSLPSAVIGTAYTGSITAANIDGASGAITLDTGSLNLPTGLSLGGRTDNGDGSYTWPVTGTPSGSAGTVTVHIAASNGTQSASTDVDIAVSTASATAPSYVGGSADYVYPGVSTVPLPAGCAAGDYLIIAGSSSSAGNAISFSGATQLLAPSTTSGKYLTAYGYPLTATDIANGYVAANVTYSYVLGVWHAPNGVALDVAGTLNAVAQFDHILAKSITTSVANTVLVPIFGNTGSTASLVPTPYPAGYALVGEANNNAYRVAALYATDSSAGATGDIDFGIAPVREQTFMVALKAK